jgi:hypothetical protein
LEIRKRLQPTYAAAASVSPMVELAILHRSLTSLVEMFFTTIGMAASITTTNVSF